MGKRDMKRDWHTHTHDLQIFILNATLLLFFGLLYEQNIIKCCPYIKTVSSPKINFPLFPRIPLLWKTPAGCWFGNTVMMVSLRLGSWLVVFVICTLSSYILIQKLCHSQFNPKIKALGRYEPLEAVCSAVLKLSALGSTLTISVRLCHHTLLTQHASR